jgi:signal transduction histidine kinase
MLEETLRRMNLDLDNFVHMASHDLKSPIGNLEGLLTLLLRKMSSSLDRDTGEIASLLLGSLRKLQQTVKDLASVSHTTHQGPEQEKVSFAAVLQQVEQDLEPQLRETGAKITTSWQTEIVSMPARQLRSVLYNLISNGIKYASPDRLPHLQLSSLRQGEKVVLTVSDNGRGLSESQLPRLFTPGQRFHPEVEGSGIGLYLLRRIVQSCNGEITAQSREGEGTTFTILLPA